MPRRSQKYTEVCQTNQRETSDAKKKMKEEKACAFSQKMHLQPLAIHGEYLFILLHRYVLCFSMLVFNLSLWSICNFTSHGTFETSVIHIDGPSELLVDTKSLILVIHPSSLIILLLLA